MISADALSVEPYGIMLRKDDPAFKKVVDDAMTASTSRRDQQDLRQVVHEADPAERHQPERADERRSSRRPSPTRPTAAIPKTTNNLRIDARVRGAVSKPRRSCVRGHCTHELQVELGHLLSDFPGRHLHLRAAILFGAGWTLATALLAWAIALSMGTLVGVIRTSPVPWLVRLGNAYVELFRNIPLLVQMFLWYFVLPEVMPQAIGDWLKQSANASFYNAVICLGLYTSARVAEQVKAGILSLRSGQRMAGLAMGLTLPQTYRYVLLPMAFRIILPPLSSEFLNIIKNSSVALTIGLIELTAAARSMSEFSFQVFEAFTGATVIYIIINIIVVSGMRWLERRVALPGFISLGPPAAAH